MGWGPLSAAAAAELLATVSTALVLAVVVVAAAEAAPTVSKSFMMASSSEAYVCRQCCTNHGASQNTADLRSPQAPRTSRFVSILKAAVNANQPVSSESYTMRANELTHPDVRTTKLIVQVWHVRDTC